MVDERCYLVKVNKLMEWLRTACLGQDAPLTEILPAHLKTAPPDQQAAQLAEQVLFALVRALPGKMHTPSELRRCRSWLQGTARYLLENCSGTDHTFAQWKKLMEIPRGARLLVFNNFEDPTAAELKNSDPPKLLKEFDVAILWFLGIHGLTNGAHTVLQKLEAGCTVAEQTGSTSRC